MRNTIAQRPPLTTFPDWCDPRRSESGLINDFHYVELRRWRAAEDDVDIRLDLTRSDEHLSSKDGALLVGETRVRLYLENDAHVCHAEADGNEVGPKVDVDLTADDARRLAAHLLMAADRIENLGGAR